MTNIQLEKYAGKQITIKEGHAVLDPNGIVLEFIPKNELPKIITTKPGTNATQRRPFQEWENERIRKSVLDEKTVTELQKELQDRGSFRTTGTLEGKRYLARKLLTKQGLLKKR